MLASQDLIGGNGRPKRPRAWKFKTPPPISTLWKRAQSMFCARRMRACGPSRCFGRWARIRTFCCGSRAKRSSAACLSSAHCSIQATNSPRSTRCATSSSGVSISNASAFLVRRSMRPIPACRRRRAPLSARLWDCAISSPSAISPGCCWGSGRTSRPCARRNPTRARATAAGIARSANARSRCRSFPTPPISTRFWPNWRPSARRSARVATADPGRSASGRNA